MFCFAIFIYCVVLLFLRWCWCIGYFLSISFYICLLCVFCCGCGWFFLEIITNKETIRVFKTSNCTADAVIPFALAHDPTTEVDHSNVAQSSMVLMSPFVVCWNYSIVIYLRCKRFPYAVRIGIDFLACFFTCIRHPILLQMTYESYTFGSIGIQPQSLVTPTGIKVPQTLGYWIFSNCIL